jgi:hypothetical protein
LFLFIKLLVMTKRLKHEIWLRQFTIKLKWIEQRLLYVPVRTINHWLLCDEWLAFFERCISPFRISNAIFPSCALLCAHLLFYCRDSFLLTVVTFKYCLYCVYVYFCVYVFMCLCVVFIGIGIVVIGISASKFTSAIGNQRP